MKRAPKIFAVYILLAALSGFLTIAEAAPGDLDATFSLDGKLIDTILATSSDRGQATAVQTDGKIVVAGTLTVGSSRSACGIVRYNVDGSLDATFDEDGKAFGFINTTFNCSAVAIQDDGKIVIAGGVGGGATADFALMRFNPNGSLDTSFDGDGKVTTNVTAYDIANSVAIQPDGKIVASGATNTGGSDFAVVRYNSDGSLDNTFDGDGRVSTDFTSTNEYANAMAIAPDGKIVLAGYIATATGADYALVRYNANGSLDTSFGLTGKIVSSVSPGSNERAQAVTVQPDGKILAAGFADNNISVFRYNLNGSSDTSFEGDGKVVTNTSSSGGSYAYAIKMQADGKIVAAGYSNNNGTFADFTVVRYNSDGSLDATLDSDGIVKTNFDAASNEWSLAAAIAPDGKIVAAGHIGGMFVDDFAVARYNADGSLDASFDNDGKTTSEVGFPTASEAKAVAVQADGKIVAAGYSNNGSNDDFTLVRYNTDGSRDASFDGDGKVVTSITSFIDGERIYAVAIQPDGKIVAAGYTYGSGTSADFALARYNSDGSLDTTFDGDGIVRTPFSGSSFEYVQSLAIQTDGKIVAAGHSSNGGNSDFAVARYNIDGSLDTSFDTDGKVTTDFTNGYEAAYGVAIQTDGKIVLAGYGSNGLNNDFALARYNSDGSLDTSFDGDGKVMTPILNANDGAGAVAIQTDGKILAAGGTRSSTNDFAFARYNTDGSLDTTFDGDGKVALEVAGSDNLTALAIQANGKIVASGFAYNGVHNDGAVARLNSNGSPDQTFGTGGTRTFDMGVATNDFIYGMTLDSIGRIVLVGETGGNFTVARILGDFAPRAAPFDFDGDGKSDISIFRPTVGEWWYQKSSDGGNAAFGFGNSSDKLVPADFTGDGKTDIAVFRPATGEWFVLRSENVSFYSFPFGTNGDTPATGDFDADGKADAVVFRPSNSTWYINKSSGGTTIQQFGQTGDVPVVSDYDGDGKSDIAIWRASTGEWWLNRSTAGLVAYGFGNSADKPVQGDYTGDGKADVAFFRPTTSEWFVLRSENLSYYSFAFGANGDVPAPADYDGDAKTDAAVFRPSSSTWFVQRTTAGILIQTFGQSGDKPVPNAYVP